MFSKKIKGIKHPKLYYYRDKVLFKLIKSQDFEDNIFKFISQSDAQILDIFCRMGKSSIRLAKLYPNSFVIGMEENHKYLHIAKRRKRNSYVNNLEIVSLSNLPLYSRQFDVVTLFFALNDLDEFYIKQLLIQISLIIKPYQKLLIVDYAKAKTNITRVFLKMYYSLFYKNKSKIDQFYDINIINILEEIGYYKIEKQECDGFKIIYALNKN